MATIALILTALFLPEHAEDPGRDAVADLFFQANRVFEEARAPADFRDAAALYEEILRSGTRSGKIHYNLGNAYLRAGDVGRAILHYRRAERLIPADPQLRENLRYARSLRIDRIERLERRRIAERVFFWHGSLSPKQKGVGALAGVILFFLLASLRLFRRSAPTAWGTGLAAALVLALGGSYGWDLRQQSAAPEAVITQEEVVIRKGNGESYAPAFEEPIHGGAEVRILDRREGWVRVEFQNGKTGWMRASGLDIL
jgi:tetratricopeptide (TPR) repeat protein